jgi:phosphoglycerol transferase MdoB-like AlkP superfamily enzyme
MTMQPTDAARSQRSFFDANSWLAAIAAIVVLWALARLASLFVFGVALAPGRYWLDLGGALVLGLGIFAFARRFSLFILTTALLFAVLHLGNAGKIAFLGAPALPDDAYALPALLEILRPVAKLLVLLPVALFVGLLIANFRIGRSAAIGAIAIAALTGLILFAPQRVTATLDPLTGYVEWDQAQSYRLRGPVVHAFQETARFVADRPIAPDGDAVALATQELLAPPVPAALVPFRPRSIHVIVEESFWDAALLSEAGLAEDPLGPELRALWNAGGGASALSPTFGGQTANAEFEFLCGYPVTERAVKFEREFSNESPCLPQILRDLGYRTVASHPNTPAFWNRTNAYRRAGFETYWAAPDFELDDLVGPFLSDRSLFRQVDEKIEAGADGRPIFNYVMTFQGHWVYDLNERYPEAIETHSDATEVGPYVSTVRYKSLALIDYIGKILEADPEAIIVVFGDHPPFLGQHFAAYAESNLLVPEEGRFDAAMLKTYAATPLLVIDGWRGPVKLEQDVPIYALPQLLLDLIGYETTTALSLTRQPAGLTVRPIKDRTLVLDEVGTPTLCLPESREPDCVRALDWLADVQLVGDDLFSGDQHLLGLLPAAPLPPAPPMTVERLAATPANDVEPAAP